MQVKPPPGVDLSESPKLTYLNLKSHKNNSVDIKIAYDFHSSQPLVYCDIQNISSKSKEYEVFFGNNSSLDTARTPSLGELIYDGHTNNDHNFGYCSKGIDSDLCPNEDWSHSATGSNLWYSPGDNLSITCYNQSGKASNPYKIEIGNF